MASIAASNDSSVWWAGPFLDVDLGRRRPQHHDPVDLLLLAEAVDVLADRLEHRPLVDRADRVVGVEPLDVGAVEGGLHRPHVAQRIGDAFEVLARLEHAGALGGDVGVVRERVPGAEHDVVEFGERHEVADERRALVGAPAEPDRRHLRERPDWCGLPAPGELDARDQRGGDGAESDGEDTEAAGSRLDGRGRRSCHDLRVPTPSRPLDLSGKRCCVVAGDLAHSTRCEHVCAPS